MLLLWVIMEALEIQSYARDFADDPQTLAEARLYVSPYDGQDITLQHIMSAVLTGDSIRPLFPDKPICAATEHFLWGVTLAEIGLARAVLAQWDLFGDIPSLTKVLTKSLSNEQQSQFTTAIEQVVAKHGEVSTDILLRRLNGELKKNIAADYHIGFERVRYHLRKAYRVLDSELENPDTILPLLKPSFPRQQPHGTHRLSQHINGIDTELVDLGRRISPRDLETIGHMVSSGGLDAEAISNVLQYLTSVRVGGKTPSNSIVNKLPTANAQLLQSLRISRSTSKIYQGRRIEDIYENTDEATKLILEVLALPRPSRQDFLSKEAQDAAAADIEASVYAEKKKQELLTGRSSDELSEAEKQFVADLDTIAATGRSAIRTLLSTHRPLVYASALKMPRRHVLLDDVVLAGMRGTLRAIRKYDYQHPSNKRFTNYAAPWVRQYMWRYIFRHAWNVSPDTGVDILRVYSALTRLRVEKAISGDKSDASVADAAAELGMPVSEAERLLILRRNIMSDGPNRYDEDINRRAFNFRPMTDARIEFASHVHKAFSQVLTEPHSLQVLELHIAADMNAKEIAEITSLPKDDVPKIIAAAITQLTTHFSQQKLFAMLQTQDSEVYDDDMPGRPQ